MRYGISDHQFLETYSDVLKSEGTMSDVVEKLQQHSPGISEGWANQKLAILRKRFKEESKGTKTIPSLKRQHKSVSDLINLFGVEV